MIGLVVPRQSITQTRAWVERSERIGVDSIWFTTPVGDVSAWLGAVSRFSSGSSVSGSGVRIGVLLSLFANRPALLVWKQIVTIDHVSDGRLDLAIDDPNMFEALQALPVEQFGPPPVQQPHPPYWWLGEVPSTADARAVTMLDTPSVADLRACLARGIGCILNAPLPVAENLLRSTR